MKRVFLVLVLLVSVSFAKVEYIYDFEVASSMAKEQDKQILVMFSMDGCPACEYMKDVAFENEELQRYIKGYFIVYEANYHDKITYPKDLSAFGTPTFYVLSNDGNKIGRAMVGGMSANVFLEKLKNYR